MPGRYFAENGLPYIDVLRHVAFVDQEAALPSENDWTGESPDLNKARRLRQSGCQVGWMWALTKASEEGTGIPASPDFSWALNQALGGLPCPRLPAQPLPQDADYRYEVGSIWFGDPRVDPSTEPPADPERGDPWSGHSLWRWTPADPNQPRVYTQRGESGYPLPRWPTLQPDLPSLNRRPGVVYLPPGRFYIDEPIFLFPGQILRGAGSSWNPTTNTMAGSVLVLRGPRAQIVAGRVHRNWEDKDWPLNGKTSFYHGARNHISPQVPPQTSVGIEDFAILDERTETSAECLAAVDLLHTWLSQVRRMHLRRVDASGTRQEESPVASRRWVGLLSGLLIDKEAEEDEEGKKKKEIDPGAYFNRVEQCRFSGWDRCIEISGNNNIHMDGCLFEGPFRYAVVLAGSVCQVTSCQFIGYGVEIGIFLASCAKNLLSRNDVRASLFKGMALPIAVANTYPKNTRWLGSTAGNRVEPIDHSSPQALVALQGLPSMIPLGADLVYQRDYGGTFRPHFQDLASGPLPGLTWLAGENLVQDAAFVTLLASTDREASLIWRSAVGESRTGRWFARKARGWPMSWQWTNDEEITSSTVWLDDTLPMLMLASGDTSPLTVQAALAGAGGLPKPLGPALRLRLPAPTGSMTAGGPCSTSIRLEQVIMPPRLGDESNRTDFWAKALRLAKAPLVLACWVRTNLRPVPSPWYHGEHRRLVGEADGSVDFPSAGTVGVASIDMLQWFSGVSMGVRADGRYVTDAEFLGSTSVHSGSGEWELLAGRAFLKEGSLSVGPGFEAHGALGEDAQKEQALMVSLRIDLPHWQELLPTGEDPAEGPWVEFSTPFVATGLFPQHPRLAPLTEDGGVVFGPLVPWLGPSEVAPLTLSDWHSGARPAETATPTTTTGKLTTSGSGSAALAGASATTGKSMGGLGIASASQTQGSWWADSAAFVSSSGRRLLGVQVTAGWSRSCSLTNVRVVRWVGGEEQLVAGPVKISASQQGTVSLPVKQPVIGAEWRLLLRAESRNGCPERDLTAALHLGLLDHDPDAPGDEGY